MDVAGLVLSLAIILFSCELFTNGIEWLGKKLKVGDGVVGSILSAVGTCLPETAIPVIAILFSGNMEKSVDISIGAIIGAPFMLGTLAFFITGASVLVFSKKRKTGFVIDVNAGILRRDLSFFILIYSIGIATTFLGYTKIKAIIAVFLIACYCCYIVLTIRSDRVNSTRLEKLYIIRCFNIKSCKVAILMQVIIALAGIVIGAELFIRNVGNISRIIGMSALTLSLIATPIATELPEKFNSVIWISKRKDTIALGNITGAMVFQSCIPVSIGILATTWQLDLMAMVSAALVILSSSFILLWVKIRGKLSLFPLLTGGFFYLMFIAYVIASGH